MTISEKIYKLRTDAGLSQKEFADKVGTSQSAINYWENGKRQPRTIQLKKIATTFDIPLYILSDDSFDMWDINDDLNKKRARFVGDTKMLKPPRFTVPSNYDSNKAQDSTVLNNTFVDVFSKYYALLNEKGQKKATEQMNHAVEQVKMLTKIPEYQKDQVSLLSGIEAVKKKMELPDDDCIIEIDAKINDTKED